jgi:O-acetyl-ADP-ribose deacetylase (regulator of RNase III)
MILERPDGTSLAILQGDLTREATDAIVNAANSTLLGGGGVDGAIHRAGGPLILAECRRIRDERGMLPPGEAVITTGGELAARHVIHTVGPVWEGGDRGEGETLARCYRSAIALADAHGLASLAFPSISTGAFGYPVDLAAAVALGAVWDALALAQAVRSVRFVLFDGRTLDAYRRAAEGLA